jgi:hypothetical protein
MVRKKAGKNTIKKHMNQISHMCQLSQIYSNHCIRATSCTLLGKLHSDIDIQSISGHKSLSGLSHYKRIDDNTKATMSKTLSKFYLPSLDLSTELNIENSCTTEIPLNQGCSNTTAAANHDGCCISYGTNTSLDSATLNYNIPENSNGYNATPIPGDKIMPGNTDWNDLTIDNFLSNECEKVEKSLNSFSVFNNCSNCSFSNITITFPPNFNI